MKNLITSKNLIKFIIFIIILIILLLLIVLFLLLRPKENNNQSQQGYSNNTNGQLIVVKPNISITRNGQLIALSKVEDEMQLQTGDKVSTDINGIGYILFADNSSITLDANTTVEVKAENDKNDSFQTYVFQSLGRTWSRVETLVGKKADYKVESPQSIAAVRGTQFGCDVSDQKTSCYAIEHSIYMTFKNLNNIPEKQIDEGKEVTEDDARQIATVDTIDDYVNLQQDLWTNWVNFNQCTTNRARTFLKVNNVLNFLIAKDVIGDCGSFLKSQQSSSSSSSTSQISPAVITSISNNGSYTTTNKITCSWTANNAVNYKIAIGSQKYASSNIMNWQSTTQMSITGSNLNLNYDKTYYCNVIALNSANQSSSIYSSSGIIFDNSTGTIVNTQPPSVRPFFVGTVGASGTFSVAPISDIQLVYSIKRNSDSFYAYGINDWRSGQKWFYVTPTDLGGGNYSYSSGKSFSPQSGCIVTIILKNKLSGRTLDQKTIITN